MDWGGRDQERVDTQNVAGNERKKKKYMNT
jgi:hypothetical protein